MRIRLEPRRALAPREAGNGEHTLMTLSEQAMMQWRFRDWKALATIDPSAAQKSDDPGRVLGLAAAGKFHCSDLHNAEEFIRLAKRANCPLSFLMETLVANAYSGVASAALLAGKRDKARRALRKSAEISSPGVDAEAVIEKEWTHLKELQTLKGALKSVSEGSGGYDRNKKTPSKAVYENEFDDYLTAPSFSRRGFSIYRSLAKNTPMPNHLIIDSKSLPRSGLHYLKNTLEELLPGHFSFCEWYQEPGCCRKMPCERTAYAECAKRTGQLKVRLLKSHDFDLRDPIYPLLPGIERLVLVRDPLFILTSWFELDRVTAHQDALSANGIDLKALWLSHDPEVVAQAVRIMDAEYRPVSAELVGDWLIRRSGYLDGFLKRWVAPVHAQQGLRWRVVQYEGIHRYVADIAASASGIVGEKSEIRLAEYLSKDRLDFAPRTDPFSLRSKRVMNDVAAYRKFFEDAAAKVRNSAIGRIAFH